MSVQEGIQEAVGGFAPVELLGVGTGQSPGGPPGSDSILQKNGELWTVLHDGKSVCLKDRIGLRHLAQLLANPGRQISVMEFQCVDGPAGSGTGGGAHAASSADEVLADRQALRECEDALDDLEDRIGEAESQNDEATVAALEEEREQVLAHIRSITGYGGRLRRVANERERARKAVSNAITRAITAVFRHHQDLGRHLRKSVRTGAFVTYDPEGPVEWEVTA